MAHTWHTVLYILYSSQAG